ncbi:MAG TPA: hypothetical protein VNA57_00065 [Acidimicrobiales bacterium]|nr:hypothetical protein [Acidimicrobiales bacterium]
MTSEERPLETDQSDDVSAPLGNAGEESLVKKLWASVGRRRLFRRWVGVLLALVLALLLFWWQLGQRSGTDDDFLVRSPSVFTVTGAPTAFGEPHFFHVVTPRPLGNSPIHLLRAQILDVPEGLVIDAVWAIRFSETSPSYIGHTSGKEAAAKYRPHFHIVSEVTLDPSCPPVARCGDRSGPGSEGTPVQDWYLLAEMHATRPGRFMATGFRVVAEVNGQTVSQSDRTMKFVVEAT